MANRIRTVIFRARIVEDMAAGDLFLGKTGKTVYRITRISKVNTVKVGAGTVIVERKRIYCERVPMSQVPLGSDIKPWPKAPAPSPLPERQAFREAARRLPVPFRAAARRIQQARTPSASEIEIPEAQREALRDTTGHVIQSPRAVRAEWRDPNDSNPNARHPRKVSGFKRADPLASYAKRSSDITDRHIIAADCYRQAWERGPGRGTGGSRLQEAVDRSMGCSGHEPSDYAVAGMRAWLNMNATLSESAQRCLQSIIIDRQEVTSWAASTGKDRRYAMGALLMALDQLCVLFKHEIAKLLRSGDAIL